jgi:Family of unknown function (DUF5703)
MNAVWEFTELTFSSDVKRSDVKTYLTIMAEIDRWEIDRVRITSDGRRFVKLRRKIFHLQRTA